MALLQDLIQQIDDPALKERILQETNKLLKQKKFGLVFEEHLPECTPLYDVPIRVGSKVALKTGYVRDIYTVMNIDGDEVQCDRRETHEQKTFKLDELVVVAEFGEPIYPTLKPLDSVENAPDSGLWHTLIEADNYHALQLLEYLYAEKVDCIYIDPPYNTGAKDWKYNNDYVDGSDAYRHSKWLSMQVALYDGEAPEDSKEAVKSERLRPDRNHRRKGISASWMLAGRTISRGKNSDGDKYYQS